MTNENHEQDSSTTQQPAQQDAPRDVQHHHGATCHYEAAHADELGRIVAAQQQALTGEELVSRFAAGLAVGAGAAVGVGLVAFVAFKLYQGGALASA